MYFIINEAKGNVLDFSQRTVRVLQIYFFDIIPTQNDSI